ncbi:hypothetical protein GCM10028819_02270 [Spirosoma humi]
MKTQSQRVNCPIISIADDDQYLYRQAFGEACLTAVIYFFTQKSQLLDALHGDVYPDPSLLIMDWPMALRKGYAALTVLAHTPAWQAIPVVIITTDADGLIIGYKLNCKGGKLTVSHQ